MTDVYKKRDFVQAALDGEIVCNIGQVDTAAKRELDRLAKIGTLTKWRGHWYPDPRWPEGLGPLKSCWALPEARNAP